MLHKRTNFFQSVEIGKSLQPKQIGQIQSLSIPNYTDAVTANGLIAFVNI